VIFDPRQGDQIGQIFNIWLLFTWVLLKFYLKKPFQNTICCTYFNIQEQFDATIFDFQFVLLLFGYSFGYISENWAIFFQLLVTLILGYPSICSVPYNRNYSDASKA
jgi:hypothetical protein